VFVITSFSSVLALFIEGRAGKFTNLFWCINTIVICNYAHVVALYILKPLFRVMGRDRFKRMQHFTQRLFWGFSFAFVALVSAQIAMNDSNDFDADKQEQRERYNFVATLVAAATMLFGASFGSVLWYHITKLVEKIESTSSFGSGDIVMVTNHARLVKVRRQIVAFSVNILAGLPWMITMWIIGTTPFVWVYYISSYTLAPPLLTWCQLTLTKTTQKSPEGLREVAEDKAQEEEAQVVTLTGRLASQPIPDERAPPPEHG
jgi:hypothetical protein